MHSEQCYNVCADGELLCRSVWSEKSGVSSTDRAISRCRQGEEMMGCSSYTPDGVRVGETITVSPREPLIISIRTFS